MSSNASPTKDHSVHRHHCSQRAARHRIPGVRRCQARRRQTVDRDPRPTRRRCRAVAWHRRPRGRRGRRTGSGPRSPRAWHRGRGRAGSAADRSDRRARPLARPVERCPGRWTPPTDRRRSAHAARLKLKAESEMDELTHLIDGERVATGQWFHTVNPATQQPWAKVARGSTQDAARAVNAARVAFDEGPWPRMTPDERGAHLHRLADHIEQHTDKLVAWESPDRAKPVTQCRARDLPRSVANFRFFADYPRFCEDESVASSTHHIYTSYEPVGVTAAISPWT